MISYYELLGMIKEDKAPNRIRVHLTSKPRVYEAEYDKSDFSHYYIYDGDADNDYRCCLAECFLEGSMFDKTIEILDEKKIPEKLNYPHIEIESSADDEIRDYLYKVKDKFDEILDYLQSKGE